MVFIVYGYKMIWMQQIMSKEYIDKCCSCQSHTQQWIALDCAHSLCIYCLQSLLHCEEKKEQLADNIQIQCPSCNYQTILSIVLAYKIVRPIREQYKSQPTKHNSLVCMDCLDQFFSIEQHLSGKHQNHEVHSIEKACLLVKDILFFQGKDLQQTKSKLYLQIEKTMHCKSKINDLLNKNVKTIKIHFQQLKQQIERKELQILNLYEQKVQKIFYQMQESICMSRKYVQLCQSHLHWIEQNIKQRTINGAYQVVDYFIGNRDKIRQLTTSAYFYKNVEYAQQVRQERAIIDEQEFKRIAQSINNITIHTLSESAKSTSTCSLKSTYFQNKRKQVKNKQSHQQFLQQDPQNIQVGATLKKMASLKCRILKS